MSSKIFKSSYVDLINQDIQEVEKYLPEHSLEKKHIISVLKQSIATEYAQSPVTGTEGKRLADILSKIFFQESRITIERAVKEVAELYAQQQTQRGTEWISVSEPIRNRSEVYVTDGKQVFYSYYAHGVFYETDQRTRLHINGITHYMYKPSPPKEK